MDRYCYCSRIVEGQENYVREHWKNKTQIQYEEEQNEDGFWEKLGIGDFHAWLEVSDYGTFYVHYLEAKNLSNVFRGLREEIGKGHKTALALQSFYNKVLGTDYQSSHAEPFIEKLTEINLKDVSRECVVRKAGCVPLPSDREEAYRKLRKSYLGSRKTMYEQAMRDMGMSHHSSWVQSTEHGMLIVNYAELQDYSEVTADIAQHPGLKSDACQELDGMLRECLGLGDEQLVVETEWLSQLA